LAHYRLLNLAGVFSSLEDILNSADELSKNTEKLVKVLDRINGAINMAFEGKENKFSWQEMVEGKSSGLRRFIVARPILDYSNLYPAKKAIKFIKNLVTTTGISNEEGVRVRLTGGVVLDYDDLVSVQKGIGLSTVISFILVTVLLIIGVRSKRLVVVSLVSLVVGLIWTLGFAIGFVGSLNMISVAFAAIFIGLGIDYSIQFSLRYRELVGAGVTNDDAMKLTVEEVGLPFLLCTLTTVTGFYAFIPTAYSGASELGIITGTGMLINLFITFTLMPPLIKWMPFDTTKVKPLTVKASLVNLPIKHSTAIVVGTIIFSLISVVTLPKMFFDYNPLNLSNPNAESVITAKELFKGEMSSPWTISVLADNESEARRLSKELQNLKEVKEVITYFDFVPKNQDKKLSIISDMALFVPPVGSFTKNQPIDYEQTIKAMESLKATLKTVSLKTTGDLSASIRRLYDSVNRFTKFIVSRKTPDVELKILETSIVENLSIVLKNLENAVQADTISESDIPKALKKRYVSDDNKYRVQVFPRKDINDIDLLEEFVKAVRSVTPKAIDAPVTILESGHAIVTSFRSASIFAAIAITVLLIVLFRNLLEVFLIMLPLCIAMVWTAATTVLLNIPFNFANIIVLPLLMGTGVDYGIHLVHRFRSETEDTVLHTSTARGVLFSALTTIAGFGSLLFSSHRGTASMGLLLTLCISYIIICTLVVLPAFIKTLKLERAAACKAMDTVSEKANM
ncbi:MAG: MMPL family transporter, partial [Candidatus Magnetoovum sp. WYHC-5]|nr:MMPL family transporter [Candidatus Magnetoovum sp. WYHC-5]